MYRGIERMETPRLKTILAIIPRAIINLPDIGRVVVKG